MLRLARDLRGLSQSDLASRVSCTQAYISLVEQHERELSGDRLSAVASALALPVEFLTQPGDYTGLGVTLVFYRKRHAALSSDLHRLQAEVAVRRLAVARLLRGVDVGRTERSFRFMDIDDSGGRADRIASLLRASWSLPAGPIPDLVALIESAGGIVFRFSFGSKDVDAISQWPDGLPPLFFINAEAPADRTRFSLAHELGHVVMHRWATEEMEREADTFAAEFLLPEAQVASDLRNLSLERAMDLKPYWRASLAALIRRAGDVHAITPETSARLWRQLSRYGWRKCEPIAISPETPRFLNALVSLYRESLGYSDEALARTVRLFPDDFTERFTQPHGSIRLAR